jgi:hypothetical protein
VLSSIVSGTGSPAATFQIRSSRSAIILLSLANSAGKLMIPNGALRSP